MSYFLVSLFVFWLSQHRRSVLSVLQQNPKNELEDRRTKLREKFGLVSASQYDNRTLVEKKYEKIDRTSCTYDSKRGRK